MTTDVVILRRQEFILVAVVRRKVLINCKHLYALLDSLYRLTRLNTFYVTSVPQKFFVL
jgi:hypothetical protein